MIDKQINTHLYHYTTAKGLCGIVESGKIWTTDIFYLNDSEEFLGGIKLTQKHLETLRDDFKIKQEAKKVSLIDRYLKDLENIAPDNGLHTYLCSFSTSDDELSQWRAYCPKGVYAIGFPTDPLYALAKKHDFVLKQCIYTLTEQKKVVEETVNETINDEILTAEEIVLAGPSVQSLTEVVASNKLVWKLAEVCPILKNATFESEAEWRLISKPRSDNWKKKRKFRSHMDMLVPFLEFDLNNDNLWKNVRVTVGPTPHPKESRWAVKKLLTNKTGFEHPVKKTKVPFRSW